MSGTLDSLLRLQHNSNANIPDGWVICCGSYTKSDGTTGYTPNLVGKFIYGAKGEDNYANITRDDNQIFPTNSAGDAETGEQEYKTGNACDRGVYEMYKFTNNPNGRHDMGDTNNAPMSMDGNRMVPLTEAEMPRHNHVIPGYTRHDSNSSDLHVILGAGGGGTWGESSPPSNYTGGPSDPPNSVDGRRAEAWDGNSRANGKAHNNMPPYYRLVFIMKKY